MFVYLHWITLLWERVYLISGFIMLVILVCVEYVVPKNPALVMLLVYLFEIMLYTFGIRISMLHADKPAVSAVAFLLVSPPAVL